MYKSLFAVLLVSMAAKATPAPGSGVAHYGRKELKSMNSRTNTEAELEKLVTYYHSKAGSFREQALQEKAAWKSALDQPLLTSKFPTLSDRARSLCSYYTAKADEAAEKAKAFELRLQKLNSPAEASDSPAH